MKLILRLIKTVVAGLRAPESDPFAEGVTNWTVLPTDLDAFGHMNNGRFAMIMDLARVDVLLRAKLVPTIIKHRWITPVGASHIDYFKPLRLFERYTVHTRIVYWDERWFFMRQEFRSRRSPDRPVAIGVAKCIFLSNEKGQKSAPVPTAEVLRAFGKDVERPPLPPELAKHFGLSDVAKRTVPSRRAPEIAPIESPAKNSGECEPVAIVGIGCRLPGGVVDVASMWQMLQAGRDCIVDIPASRWDGRRFHDPEDGPGRSYLGRAGMLEQDVYAFDAAFFGISPREAESLDPQQRLLLEVSWEALEDAGLPASDIAGSRTGVFVGGFTFDNALLRFNSKSRAEITHNVATSSSLTMLASRLSYFYDLRGPCFALDTACSSSLVAIHQACASLRSGESEMALAGGVNVLLAPETQIAMAKGRFLSRRGHCSAFSDKADGYVRGEGAGVVVLKPLSKAQSDGDLIYAVIRGSAVNQDGRTKGITVPSEEAQVRAMRTAYSQAGIDPATVAYLEAHGTGTPLGDPIEARAIGRVMGAGRSSTEACSIGSVKTNIGHLEAASGVAGMIKASLCLYHGNVVPHADFGQVNPAIDLEALNLEVVTQGRTIVRRGSPLRAGVNSFGYGGTNAHIVLEEASDSPVADSVVEGTRPLTLALSARKPEALYALAELFAAQFEREPGAAVGIGRSAAQRRTHHRRRAFVHADSAEAMVERLRALACGRGDGDGCEVGGNLAEQGKVMFVYTGMGPQWWAMGRELYAAEVVFREALTECDTIFQELSGWSIAEALLADESRSQMARTEVAQPANFVIQVGLTRLLESWGLSPDGVVGHSIGEAASAWASGALSLRDALTVVLHRSRLQQRTAGTGAMMAVSASLEEAEGWVRRFGDISIAADNSAGSVTLSGEPASLDALAAELGSERFNKRLRVDIAYHSPKMDPLEEELRSNLSKLSPGAPTRPLYSTVTGARFAVASEPGHRIERHDATYWWRNTRREVRFAAAMRAALSDGFDVFVEVGPHPVLAASMQELFDEQGASAHRVATLVRKKPEQASMARSLGQLYGLGVDPDWSAYYGEGPYVRLPLYPWQRDVHWGESEASRRYRFPYTGHPLVAEVGEDGHWRLELNGHASNPRRSLSTPSARASASRSTPGLSTPIWRALAWSTVPRSGW